ncbi:MAG: hypothetical protein U9P37_08970 [Pseudomonadota bacterium]|nr:hypothetical protein [Pseudomonadota bacterium]
MTNGEYGDDGKYYKTLLDLESDTSRDTWSYYMMRGGRISNLTEDDRYYFYTLDGSEDVVGLYRIDTLTTGDDKTPYVFIPLNSTPLLFSTRRIRPFQFK